MSSLRWLVVLVSGPGFLCFLAACSINPGASSNPASTQSETSESSSSGGASQHTTGSKSSAHAGQAGSKHSANAGSGDTMEGDAGDANVTDGDAGEANTDSEAAGATADPADAGPPPPPCDLEGNCDSQCRTKVTCGIQRLDECEFAGFEGATAEVACGQRATVGVACCGACGCVPVELYFDGTSCWQGIPQCNGNAMRAAHAPTTPNPSFTPNTAYGTFYPGGAGAGAGGGVGSNTPESEAGSSGARD